MQILFIFSLFLFSGMTLASLEPLSCSQAMNPLFSMSDANDYIDLEIMLDHKLSRDTRIRIKNKNGIKTKAIISYTENGSKYFIPVQIEIGSKGSRSFICKLPSFKIYFESGEMTQQVLSNSRDRNIESIFEAYKAIAQQIDFKGHKQQNNLFAGVGRSIKLVTHCGVYTNLAAYSRFRLGTEEEYQANILKEHYIHQLQATLGTLTKLTRLASITYIDKTGEIWQQKRWGFFREGRSSIAKRCGLRKKQESSTVEVRSNNTSFNQARLMNNFFTNFDYSLDPPHNISKLYKNQEIFFAPYDYDLASLNINYESRDLDLLAFQYSRKSFKHFINILDSDFLAVQAQAYINAKPQMELILRGSLLPETYKMMASEWMQNYFSILEASI